MTTQEKKKAESLEDRVARLEKENARLKQENEIYAQKEVKCADEVSLVKQDSLGVMSRVRTLGYEHDLVRLKEEKENEGKSVGNFYDFIIKVDWVKDLFIDGWEVHVCNPSLNPEVDIRRFVDRDESVTRVGVIGGFGIGKSWILSQLSEHTFLSGDKTHTQGFSIKEVKMKGEALKGAQKSDRSVFFFDTKGTNSPCFDVHSTSKVPKRAARFPNGPFFSRTEATIPTRGLQNPTGANLCFANVVVQVARAVGHVPEPSQPLASVFAAMNTMSDPLPYQMVTELVRAYGLKFELNKQHDAHEFFMEAIRPSATNTVQTKTTCKACNKGSLADQAMCEVFLDLAGAPVGPGGVVTVQSLLSHSLRPEPVSQVSCMECGGPQEASKTRTYTMSGDVVIIVLKRFMKSGEKLMTPVALDEPVSIGDCHYSLVAVIYHSGMTPATGHYTAAVRSPENGGFYLCDDAIVKAVDLREIGNDKTPYVLFYKKGHLNSKPCAYDVEQFVKICEVYHPNLPAPRDAFTKHAEGEFMSETAYEKFTSTMTHEVNEILHESKSADEFLRQITLCMSDVFLFVVGQMSHKDQIDLFLLTTAADELQQQDSVERVIIVLHNLRNIPYDKEFLRVYIQDVQKFYSLELKNGTFLDGFMAVHGRRDGHAIKVRHYFITKDDGKEINKLVFERLRTVLSTQTVRKRSLSESFAQSVQRYMHHFVRCDATITKIHFDEKNRKFCPTVQVTEIPKTVQKPLGSFMSMAADSVLYNVSYVPYVSLETAKRSGVTATLTTRGFIALVALELPGLRVDKSGDLTNLVKVERLYASGVGESGLPGLGLSTGVKITVEGTIDNIPESILTGIGPRTGNINLIPKREEKSKWCLQPTGNIDLVVGAHPVAVHNQETRGIRQGASERKFKFEFKLGVSYNAGIKPIVSYLDGILTIGLVEDARTVEDGVYDYDDDEFEDDDTDEIKVQKLGSRARRLAATKES